ncbi:electron transfer flavoprotein subunit beta, partial [Klebsiella aerogenes]
LQLTQAADKLTQLFEFQDDGALSYFAVSAIPAGETDGWSQLNVQIPYRAL